MNKMIKGFVVIALATGVFAQTATSISTNTSSTSVAGVLESLKASDFSLGILNETVVAAEGANGYTNSFYFYPGYKINDTFTVKAVPVITANYSGPNKSQSDMNYDYNYMSARLYVSNILTEAEHGVRMNLQIRDYIYRGSARGENGVDQKLRIYPSLSKTFGNLSVAALAFVEFYDKNNKTRSTNQRNDYFGLSTTYSFNDNWSMNVALEYYNNHNTLIEDDVEALSLTLPNIGYSYKDISANLYLFTDITVNKDNRALKADPLADASVVAEVFYSMF